MMYTAAHLFDGPQQATRPEGGTCDHVSCREPGDYRAPMSRDGGYYWFCLEHVRGYNASWNYFAGMSDDELDHYIKNDVGGQRPCWPLHARVSPTTRASIHNTFDVEDLRDCRFSQEKKSQSRQSTRPPKELDDALVTLEMGYPFSRADLKRHFRLMVKKYHPDAHPKDHDDGRLCKDKMVKINEAYALLKGYASAF